MKAVLRDTKPVAPFTCRTPGCVRQGRVYQVYINDAGDPKGQEPVCFECGSPLQAMPSG